MEFIKINDETDLTTQKERNINYAVDSGKEWNWRQPYRKRSITSGRTHKKIK